jgi:hypothetical protein
MMQDPDLEQRVQKLIIDIDPNKVIELEDGTLQVVHPGEEYFDYARPRKPYEMSLAKLTRKLFVNRQGDFGRIPLTAGQIEEVIYFTGMRKLQMGYWTTLAAAKVINDIANYGPIDEKWQMRLIEDGKQFLRVMTGDVLKRGDRLYDKKREKNFKGSIYVAGEELKIFWDALYGRGEKQYIVRAKKIMSKGSDKSYHMALYFRNSIPSDSNNIAVVYQRVKSSSSHNKKQAEKWAKDIEDMAGIEMLRIYGLNADVNKLPKSDRLPYIEAKQKEKELSSDNRPNHPLMFGNRFEEVWKRYYYDVEDSTGFTIAFSHSFSDKNIHDIVEYFRRDSLFEFVEGSEDDHRKNPEKPYEFLFKIRVRKDALKIAFGEESELFRQLYMPDTIEVQITSLPDIVHKYVTPGLCESDYITRKEAKTPNANFQNIFQKIQEISPVKNTGRVRAYIQALENIMSSLSFSSPVNELDEPYSTGLRYLFEVGAIKIR